MLRTEYSFRNAAGTIDDVVARVKEIGWQHLPIADFCSTFAHGYIANHGLKPIYGITLPISPNVAAKKPVSCDVAFFATTEVAPIYELMKRAFENFRYTALLRYSEFQEAKGVIKIVSHKAQLDDIEPHEDIYIGLSGACSKGYIRDARERGFKFCAIQNNRFPRPEDLGFYEVLAGRGAFSQTYNQFIASDDEWLNEVGDNEFSREALANRDAIFKACEGVTIPQTKLLDPHIGKSLREICVEGAVDLGIDLSDPVYSERLETELKVISDKGLDDYFKIFSDFMQYARKETICGPARGSASGSLVAYLSKITAVDPIKGRLLFFRFLDPARNDAADIDVDIASVDRDRVIDYLVQKYGKERVARLGTVANFQAKNTIDEVSKALRVPKYMAEETMNALPSYSAGDSRTSGALSEALDTPHGQAFLKKFPEMDVARRFGGHSRHAGVHAAGVILTDAPITNFFGVDARSNVIHADGKVAEQRGALKADLLGLLNLSIFKQTLELAGLPMNYLESLPLDDPKVYETLNIKGVGGVFQLEGAAARRYAEKITFESIEDICSISAIARPGPMSSGAADKWVRRKNGTEPVTYAHETLEPYLKNTLGLLLMQEDLMLIAREVAGMEWSQVTALRKAVGKSLGDEAMREYRDPFVLGLINKGVPEETAQDFWREILGWAKYGFSRNHSYAYAIISYWCAYLKTYCPLEYAAASLTFRDNKDAQVQLLRELASEGIGYVPVDPENSADKWRVVNGKLIGPLTMIRGIGPKMVQTILSCRARGETLPDRARKLLETAKTEIDSLSPIRDAMIAAGGAEKGQWAKVVNVKNVELTGDWQRDVYLAGLVTKCEVRDENEPRRVQDRLERGQKGLMDGETRFLEIRLTDDTGTMFVKIGKKDFASRAQSVIDNLKVNKSLVFARGTIPPSIGMLLNDAIWKLGEM